MKQKSVAYIYLSHHPMTNGTDERKVDQIECTVNETKKRVQSGVWYWNGTHPSLVLLL